MDSLNRLLSTVIFGISIFTLAIVINHLSPVEAYSETAADTGDEGSQAQAEPSDGISPAALSVLGQMSDTLDALKSFSFEADISFDTRLNSGQMVKLGGEAKITVKRPNMIYGEFSGDRAKREVWFDGNMITILNVNNGFYGQLDTPDTIDTAMDYVMDHYGFTVPLADIVHTDSYQAFTESALSGALIYDSKIGDKECSHLAFVGEKLDWQIWVSKDDKALPCKLVITYKSEEEAPQYQAVFSNWNLSAEAPDSMFKPDLPKDAVKINFLDVKAKREAQ